MVLRFDRVAGEEFEDVIANLDLTTVGQNHLGDPLAIDKRAVGAAAVFDCKPGIGSVNLRVSARDRSVVTEDFTRRFAADLCG